MKTCILIPFFIINFEQNLAIGHMIKSRKQLKCTLKNRAVFLKHVPVTWVRQYGLNNLWTIESNVHIITVTGIYLGEGWGG